jgi:hypothetical protein
MKENLDDICDYIKLGTFNEDGSFTEDETIEPFELPMGILRGDVFDDLSQYGITVRDIELGVNLMEFISFNIYRELAGIGFESKRNSKMVEEGLSIAPWMYNTYNESHKGILFWFIGTPTFYIHTHSGKEGSDRYGYAKPSRLDRRQYINGYDHYILSRNDGLAIYYPTGIYHKPVEKRTPSGLRKKIK